MRMPTFVVAVVVALAGAVSVFGQLQLVATRGSDLVTIDIVTGEVETLLARPFSSQLTGLAYDRTTDRLFALENEGRNVLVTPRSMLDFVNNNEPNIDGSEISVNTIAFDGAGTMYGIRDVRAGEQLLTISTVGSSATVVGTLDPGGSFDDIDFDVQRGVLVGEGFGSDALGRIDVGSGLVESLGFSGLGDLNGFAIDPATGVYYGLSGTDELITFDPVSGVATVVAPLSLNLFDGASLTFIPSPGTAVVLALPALVSVRRRR